MSYILDALKKSEEQRPPGTVPDLFAVHGPQAPAPPRSLWPFAAVALSLAAAGFAAWVGFRAAGGRAPEREEARPAAAAPAPTAPAARAAPVVAVREPVPEIPLAPPVPKGDPGGFDGRRGTETARKQVPAATAPAGVVGKALPTPVPRAETAWPPAAAPASAAPEPVDTAPAAVGEPGVPPPDGTVLDLAELPDAVRAELPAVAITGHVWSEDASMRMLTLQDRILREGSEAVPGVRVEEITPEGAVLSFKGYRYRTAGF